jgi:hypothetical protein
MVLTTLSFDNALEVTEYLSCLGRDTAGQPHDDCWRICIPAKDHRRMINKTGESSPSNAVIADIDRPHLLSIFHSAYSGQSINGIRTLYRDPRIT